MEYARTAHNRSVYASPPVGGSDSEKPQSGYALCGVFLRHILARRNATHCGGPKRHIQAESCAKLVYEVCNPSAKYLSYKELALLVR
jgi:hypothetical protein